MSCIAFESVADIIEHIRSSDIESVSLQFTDCSGLLRQINVNADEVDERLFEYGIRAPECVMHGPFVEGEVLLKPVLDRAYNDPFSARAMLILGCDVVKANDFTDAEVNALGSMNRLKTFFTKSKADVSKVVAEVDLWFYIFDEVKFGHDPLKSGFEIKLDEDSLNSGSSYDYGNSGYRTRRGNNGCSTIPFDYNHDIRIEMCNILKAAGINVIYNAHGSLPGQHSISFRTENIFNICDIVQRMKYVIRNVAGSYGKSATFMPGVVAGCGSKKSMRIIFDYSASETSNDGVLFRNGISSFLDKIIAFSVQDFGGYRKFWSVHNKNYRTLDQLLYFDTRGRLIIDFADAVGNIYWCISSLLAAGMFGVCNKIGEFVNKELQYDMKSAVNLLNVNDDLIKLFLSDEQVLWYKNIKDREIMKIEGNITVSEFDFYYNL